MINRTRFFVPILVLFLMSACANMDTVNNAPASAGISKTYNEDYELVKAATLASMQSLNINIKQSSDTAEGFTISFTKSISAFSWGEVGRVLVARTDQSGTKVFVHSARRVSTNVTGASEGDFASSIFSGINEILSRSD